MRRLADTHAMLAVEYVHRFGVARGTSIMFKMNWRMREVKLNVPGYKHRIALRPKTSDVPAFSQVFVRGDYDFEYPVKDPKLIVDAGAYVGYSTVYFASRFPNAEVIAIEPESSNFGQLKFNSSPYKNASALNMALWPEKTHVCINNPDSQKWMARVENIRDGSDPRQTISTITADEILSMTQKKIDIFKIDIEGGEMELFAGNTDWIDKVGMFAIELHDWIKPGCVQSFYKGLGDRPFRQWFHGESAFVLML